MDYVSLPLVIIDFKSFFFLTSSGAVFTFTCALSQLAESDLMVLAIFSQQYTFDQ